MPTHSPTHVCKAIESQNTFIGPRDHDNYLTRRKIPYSPLGR
jgi:hypothetical protein